MESRNNKNIDVLWIFSRKLFSFPRRCKGRKHTRLNLKGDIVFPEAVNSFPPISVAWLNSVPPSLACFHVVSARGFLLTCTLREENWAPEL